MCSAANAQLQRSCSVDKETDMLVQLNGFHTHVSDLAKKEMDKIIKDKQRELLWKLPKMEGIR